MLLPENQVNTTSLAEIFNSAFMDVSKLNNESFVVKGEHVPIEVNVDTNNALIKFLFYDFIENININKALKSINELNDTYIMVQFAIKEQEKDIVYVTRSYMSFKKGLIKHQLIDNLRLFEKIVLDAGVQEFGEHLS